MNISIPTSGHRSHHINPIHFPTADSLVNDLVHLVVAFILASVTASLLGSKHAPRYGIFGASLSIWRVSIALASTAMLITMALAVSSLFHYLYAAITPETATSHGATSQESTDAVHHTSQQDDVNVDNSQHEKTPTNLPHFKLLFFPSRTTHRRLHPKPHAFNYSYLLVGIPVIHRSINTNQMLSTHPTAPHQHKTQSPRSHSQTKPAWFSVYAFDYLQRGSTYKNLTLREKLDIYLKSQGVLNPEDTFPYVYLITAPRFLGFSFNPVSFWYLYDVDQELEAMILEVNNTFDERRIYFLYRGDDGQKHNTNEGEARDMKNDSISQSTARFTNKWKKDFHVSPFNDREGTYSVSATDVLRTGRLDVTIVLSDDHEHDYSNETTPMNNSDSTTSEPTYTKSPPQLPRPNPKIIARVYTPNTTSHIPICPSTLPTSLLPRLLFIFRHGLTGFLTNPRILLEARKLWTKGLQVFYRPEPLDTTIPRVESDEEVVVEERFREVVRRIAKVRGVGVQYVAAAGVDRAVEVELGVAETNTSAETETRGKTETPPNSPINSRSHSHPKLQIRTLTPTFYTELAKSPDPLQTIFDNFGVNALNNEKLADFSDFKLLRVVLVGGLDLRSEADRSETIVEGESSGEGDGAGKNGRMYYSSSSLKVKAGWHNFVVMVLQWLVYRLRRPRSTSAHQPPPSPSSSPRLLSPPAPKSQLDHLIQQTSTHQQYTSYLRAVLMILLADRFALSSTGLLRFEMKLARGLVVLVVVWIGMRFMGYVRAVVG